MNNGLRFDINGAYIEKNASASLIYGMDWSRWLIGAGGLQIAAHTWQGESGIEVDPVSLADGKSYVRVSGGTAGIDYLVTCTITLSDTPAQTESRSIRIRVVDRRLIGA